ncbi:hypothetical protein KS03_5622 (plasmid) [Burkholderia glumae LMG 2196 = ATCC 33617]|nr:hypothetical protein KS03_5622 [Burkholderia glumae LMG 2196 = ATCC 33617]
MKTSDKDIFLSNEMIGLGEELSNRQENYFSSIHFLAERDISFFKNNYELAKELYLNVTMRCFVMNHCPLYKKYLENYLAKNRDAITNKRPGVR